MSSKAPQVAAHAARPALPAVAVIIVSTYIAAQMISDVASLKIGLVLGLAVDMGTFIYPITFTLRDTVHKTLGRRNARLLIVVAGVINIAMAAYMLLAAAVKPDPSSAQAEAFRAVFTPVWRIVIASIAAEILSELTDTEVYHWFVTRVTRSQQWARVLVSNSVSIPIDNLIFSVGAFGWSLPWITVFEIFLFNLMVKYLVTLVSIPLIYVVPERASRP